jgi:AcrR family transcriptional regulator
MDAALRVLDRKNIVDATVEDIVRDADIARGTFYIYFKDKFDVLKALSIRENEHLFADSHINIHRQAHAYDRLRTSLRNVIRHWESHANLFRSLTQMALAREDFYVMDRENRLRYIEKIRADLDSSIARGRAHPIDPAVAAKALAAMMDWFCLLWFGMNEPPYEGADDPAQVDHVADHVALLWYRAIYAEDPQE